MKLGKENCAWEIYMKYSLKYSILYLNVLHLILFQTHCSLSVEKYCLNMIRQKLRQLNFRIRLKRERKFFSTTQTVSKNSLITARSYFVKRLLAFESQTCYRTQCYEICKKNNVNIKYKASEMKISRYQNRTIIYFHFCY